MNYSARVLGAPLARDLAARAAAPLLTIGSDRFARADLAGIGCFNFLAAQRLSSLIADLPVKHTKDLFDKIPPEALALPGIGAVSLAVIGAAFEARGLGGDAPLEAWVTRHHRAADQRDFTTFHTIKAREAKRDAEVRADEKRRKDGRRNKAHRTRVDRFLDRQPTSGASSV